MSRPLTVLNLLLLAGALTAGIAHADAPAPPKTFETGVVLTTEIDDLAKGGLNPGLETMSNVDVTAIWRGPDGWEAHGYILGDFGGGFSANRVGDVQVTSNIDTVPAWRLFEAYIKKTYGSGHITTSFGLMNLNNVFDVQKNAKLFENPSHGIGPDFSQTGPSIFPISALGSMTVWHIRPDLKWRFGVFDGVPGDPAHPKVFVAVKLSRQDGVNLISELEKDFPHGYVKGDVWGDTAPVERLDGTGSGHHHGAFAQVGFNLAQDASSGLSGWVRAGDANGEVDKLDRYFGFGLTSPGPFKGDQMGVAVAQAHFGQPYRAVTPAQGPRETNYELTFTHTLNDRLSVQPDLQYVHRPYGQTSIPDATVLSLRLVYTVIGGS